MNYVIEKKATIENASALFDDLTKWFSMDDNNLTIDLSSAETIDFSFIQLMIFLGNKAFELGKTTEIKNSMNEALVSQLGEMYILNKNLSPVEALNGLLGLREKV